MEYFKTFFNEDEWTIYLIDDDDTVIADEDTVAEVKFDNKEIYFRKNSVTLNIILHELWHVYFQYCYLADTSEIALSDMEEITCSLFADRAEKIISRGKELLEKLTELRERKDETS